MALVNLADRADSRVGELSGGMVRRLGIAAALVGSPDYLLLDEPTAGLDPEQRSSLHDLLRSIPGTTSVLFATHLLEDVLALDCTVVVLDGGRVAFRGRPEELAVADPDADRLERLRRGFLSLVGEGN